MHTVPMPLLLADPTNGHRMARDPAFQALLDDGRVLAYELCTVHTDAVSALSLSAHLRVLLPDGGGARWIEGHRAIRDAHVPGLVDACFVLLEGARDFLDPDALTALWIPYDPRPFDRERHRTVLVTQHALVVGAAYPEAALERELRQLETCLSLAAWDCTERAWQEAGMDVGGLGTLILPAPEVPSAHARVRIHQMAMATFATWLHAYPEWSDPKWRIGPPQP